MVDGRQIETFFWMVGISLLFTALMVWAMPWLDPTRDLSIDGIEISDVQPSKHANAVQVTLIKVASNFAPLVDVAGFMSMVQHESAGTYDKTVRPCSRGGWWSRKRQRCIGRKGTRPIGSATGLCQMIASTRIRYGLPLSTKAMQQVSAEKQALACVQFRRDHVIAFRRLLFFKKQNCVKAHGASKCHNIKENPSDGDLYLSHFLGFNGAKRLIAKNGNTPVKVALSNKVIRANKFLKRLRTVKNVRKWADRKMAANKRKVARYIKGQPLVAGWVAFADNKKVNDPGLWINKQAKFTERFSFENWMAR